MANTVKLSMLNETLKGYWDEWIHDLIECDEEDEDVEFIAKAMSRCPQFYGYYEEVEGGDPRCVALAIYMDDADDADITENMVGWLSSEGIEYECDYVNGYNKLKVFNVTEEE